MTISLPQAVIVPLRRKFSRSKIHVMFPIVLIDRGGIAT